MDDYVKFVDHISHIYLDGFGTGPAVEYTVSFLFSRPELSRREHTLHLFKLCCVCLGYVAPCLPKVELRSGRVSAINIDLSCIIEPLQADLLSSS